MFDDIHISTYRQGKSITVDELLGKVTVQYEYDPEPCCDDRFHSSHRNDQGERTNKKLRVQPFYHRDRSGKMRRF